MTLDAEERQLPLDNLLGSLQVDHRQKIDHDFPEQFVDSLSSREVLNKHLFRPNTYLHKWWARRCGSTFRTILKQFVVDDKYADYYTPGGLQGKTILDPMMGGGTTLHEALRLGANVIGADIDPIPVAQARASLTQADLAGLRASFTAFFDQLHSNLKPYFQTECVICSKSTDIQYTLYGVKKRCACREVVQIDRYELRYEAGRTISVNPQDWEVSCHVGHNITAEETPRLITKSEKDCPECGYHYDELLDHPFYLRYTPIAIASVCKTDGLFFRSPSELDLARIGWADEQRSRLDFGALEDFDVKAGPKSDDLLQHNIKSYLVIDDN
jgi:putative DNA methylase